MSKHQSDTKKPQTSSEQNTPVENHEHRNLNPDYSSPPDALQRAVTEPSSENLTPDVVRQMQRRYGNRFTAGLVAQRHRDTASGSHIQRLFDIVTGNPIGPQNTDKKQDSIQSLIKALRGHAKELKQYETKENEGDVDTCLNHKDLELTVGQLFDSSVDFGRIDPNNPQQLSLLYFKIKQKLKGAGKKESQEEEEEAKKKQQEDTGKWNKYVTTVQEHIKNETKVENTTVLKLAILGRGASVGYYLVNNASSIDPATTKIIGLDNPWARERGEGVINHPMNMIAPENDTEYLDDKEGLANRAKFAEEVDKIIKRIGEKNIVNASITGVEKKGAGATSHYQITTSKGIYYAQNVVVGMGIGGHKNPDDDPKGVKERGRLGSTGLKRVMNMDEFQVAVTEAKLSSKDIGSMVIVGPNAAIDVMTTAIRQGFGNVSWVVGSAKNPFFLEGTDNIYAQKKYKDTVNEDSKTKGIFEKNGLTVYQHDYLTFNADDSGVTVGYGIREDKVKGISAAEKGTIKADIMVYGTGPDVGALQTLLGIDKKGTNVEAIYDKSLTFNAGETGGDAVQQELMYYITGINGNQEEKAREVITALGKVLGEFTKITHKDAMPEALPQVLGLKAKKTDEEDQSSLQIIGGSASRIAGEARMKYTYVSEAFQGMINDYLIPLKRKKYEKLGNEEKDKIFAGNAIEFLNTTEEFLNKGMVLAKEIERAEDISKVKDTSGRITEIFDLHKKALELLNNVLLIDVFAVSDNADFRKMDGLQHTGDTAFRQLEELLKSFQQSKYANQMSTQMTGVNTSLPQNVVLNDQLTPTRSDIEALSNAMPANVEGGVNFVTANQNVIGAYLASAFGNIPPILANYITDRIVAERRTRNDVLPKPENDPNMKDPNSKFTVENQRRFVDEWKKKLGNVNQLLDPAALKK